LTQTQASQSATLRAWVVLWVTSTMLRRAFSRAEPARWWARP
jgi:hypothetical protein